MSLQSDPVIQTNASPTLDGLFRRILARQPDALALLDPINKPRITGQPPKRLTFAEADRAISALSTHFIEAGLPANSVIAIQLPNTVEFMLTVLAAHRAGLIVALLPLLWRQAELTVALNRTGARAIVTTSRIDGVSHADLAMNAAVEAFSIRHVCGFGNDLPEGMVSLDRVLSREPAATRAVPQDGRKAAVISFDVTSDGFRAVPRTHLNLIAGGLALFLESDVPQGATMMSAFAPSSFAGLTSSLLVWLLSGGTLALHHPFDGDVLEQQINDDSCDTLVAPAQLALRLTEIDMPARLPRLRNVIGLWRAPEQVASSALWTVPNTSLTDVYLFGEAGLVRRLPRRRWRAGADPAGTPWRAARRRRLVDRGRNPDHAKGNAGAARTDGRDRGLCSRCTDERVAGGAAAARSCRYRVCRAARPFDRSDLHYRTAFGHHGRRRLPFSVAGSAGMVEAAWTGRVADGVARPAQRPSSRRPRPGQCPRARSAGGTRA